MNRRACLDHLHQLITDEIIVAAYSTASDWITINERPLNYYFFGAMGLASSHAIGLALAYPERNIIVLDGDGSLLMNLGTLVTMASLALPNLHYSVWHNGSYEANGGHPLPSTHVDFCGLAKSAGFTHPHRITTTADFHQIMPAFIRERGPSFAEIIIEHGPIGPRSYKDMYSKQRRERFKAALHTNENIK